MIVCQFNLSSTQLQTLVAFRVVKDTRTVEHHPFHDVGGANTVTTMRKLCQEGYVEWFDTDRQAGTPPGYKITAKGEMMLRIIEDELRRNLRWFEGEPVPDSKIQGSSHDLAAGKSEVTPKGRIRRKKTA